MKRAICFVTTIVLLLVMVCFCGCDNQKLKDVKLLEEGCVKNVSITSIPEGYEYLFSEGDAKAVVDYLSNLNLITNFKESPNGLRGMTWVISLEYENGDIMTVYHYGNMFIRTENGPWYQMTYEEANRFEALLNELNELNELNK